MTQTLRQSLVFFFAATALLLVQHRTAKAQIYMEKFGQNRIQTRKYNWRFFDTQHFRVYHYDAAGRELARYVAEQAEKDIRVIEKKLGGKFPKRFNIILYNNYDEYLQTNIGRKNDGEAGAMPAGKVDLVGDKLVVYFTGVHTDLRKQLRAGMARVVMQKMLFGESFREMVKNALLLNLPEWITSGYIAYLVDGWDAASETEWKNLLQVHPNRGFFELAEARPEIAGKAFWKFVSENYGEQSVKSLLYTMELKSSLSQAMRLSFGMKVKDVYDSVIHFYQEVYAADASRLQAPDSLATAILQIPVPKGVATISNITVAPRGNDVAYVYWKNGEFKVFLQHTKSEQAKSVIISGGVKDYNEQQDPNYPLLAWSNNGYKLAVLYKKGRKTRLRIYNSLRAKIEDYIVPNNRFDRVLGMAFMEDDTKLVFSAVKKSKTDLYEFTIRRARIRPITSDAWDDIEPTFVSGGSRRGILFLSNRPLPDLNVPIAVNELPTGPMNLFFYDTKTKSPHLLQVSHHEAGTISKPIQYGYDNFAFLNDRNGINNKYVVLFDRDQQNRDSAYAVPVTNYAESILSHQYNPASRQVAEVIQVGDQYKVFFKPLQLPDLDSIPKELEPTTLSIGNKASVVPIVEETNTVLQPLDEEPILKKGEVFQSEFSDDDSDDVSSVTVVKQPASASSPDDYPADDRDSVLVDSTYIKLRAQPYRLSFKPDFFTVRIDNSILFDKYQPAAILGGQPRPAKTSGLITVSLEDALENHRVTGGFKIPLRLTGGTTYFLQYENFERRVDWSVLFLRDANTYLYKFQLQDPVTKQPGMVLPEDYIGKATTNLLQGSASYPLDRRRSIRMSLAVRQDMLDFKATDSIALKYVDRENEFWTMSRVEYVFDNTTNPVLNIWKGLRYKFYAEYFYKLSAPNGGFFNIGMDVRHYLPVYKNIILASRLAYAHSEGNQQVNYMMGGVDNTIFEWGSGSSSASLPPPASANYAFQTPVTNLRGYKQNARQGNSFALVNAELRAPILTSILRRPIQSAFLKNLQMVGFVDVGSAWTGWVPNGDNQPNYVFGTYNQTPMVLVSLPAPQNGVAIGYGVGLRTLLFGYFLRVDSGWNIEQQNAKPTIQVSFGTDF